MHRIGRGDRLAIILPNGPELATAFLSVACCATAAPLNPALTEQDIEFCLRDFGVRALVVAEGSCDAARTIAASLGLDVLDLRSTAGGPAGCIELKDGSSATAPVVKRDSEPAGPDEFGPVQLSTGPMHLAAAGGAPLIPVFAIRDGAGAFVVTLDAPLLVEARADREKRKHDIAARYAGRLEPWVRRYPGQWLGE